MTQKNEPTGDRYFGVCPICKQTDGYLNIGRSHGFVCHAHKKKWCMGSNLFSAWRYQSEEEWEENWNLLERYCEVEPL